MFDGDDLVPEQDECPTENLQLPSLPFAPEESEDQEPTSFSEDLFDGEDQVPEQDECPTGNLQIPSLPFAPSSDESLLLEHLSFEEEPREDLLEDFDADDLEPDMIALPQIPVVLDQQDEQNEEEEEEKKEDEEELKVAEDEEDDRKSLDGFGEFDQMEEDLDLSDEDENKPQTKAEDSQKQIENQMTLLMKKQATIKNVKKGKNQVDNLVNQMLNGLYSECQNIMRNAMDVVSSKAYRDSKMADEKAAAEAEGREVNKDIFEEFELLNVMDEHELAMTLISMLPIIKLNNEGKYMIGAEAKTIIVKTDRLFIRVGGGYDTLEDFIKQNAPFECIKIYKVQRDKQVTYPEAVKFYLTKHKATNKIIAEFLKEADETYQLGFFKKTLDLLKEKQQETNKKYQDNVKARASMSKRGSMKSNRSSITSQNSQTINPADLTMSKTVSTPV